MKLEINNVRWKSQNMNRNLVERVAIAILQQQYKDNKPPTHTDYESLARAAIKAMPKASRDTERLNWLIKHDGRTKHYEGQWWTEYGDSQEPGATRCDTLELVYCKTPRKAIDAAMSASKKAHRRKK